MRGQILGVDGRTGRGVIAGDDGTRYTFGRDDWSHQTEPAVGSTVDFEADGQSAVSLFPMPKTPAGDVGVRAPVAVQSVPHADRNKLVAAVLALFVGTLGLHRFYLGRIGSGITMLILSVTVFGLIVTAPWAFIDAIRYLVMSDEGFAVRYRRR